MSTHVFSQEGRLEELLRHTSDVVVELAPDGRLVYVSDSVERVLGRTAASLTGSNFLEIVMQQDRKSALAVFRKVVETGDESLIRLRIPHTDGHRIEFETTIRCFISGDDRQRIVAVCRDITERSTRGAADQKRSAHHRAIAQSAARPAAIVAADGTLLFSNRRFRQIFGSNVNLDNTQKGISEESRGIMDSAWHRALLGQDVTSGVSHFEYTHEDGSTSWFSVTWEAIRSDEKNRRFTLFYEDITQRKKMEHALRAVSHDFSDCNTETLQPIMAIMAEALDMDRLVLGVLDDESNQLRILVAWQDGEFLADSHLELDGLPDLAVRRGEICIHSTGVCELTPPVAERIGPDFESYAGFPLKRLDGRVIGVLGAYGRKAIRDASALRSLMSSFAAHAGAGIDRHRLDTEIRGHRDRFDAVALQSDDIQAQKMETVGRLAGGIAHDFNNLLTAIIGYSHLVLDEFGEGHGAQRDIEEILRAAERAGGLTNQLLAFSRREVLRPKPVDLNAVVVDIDRMLRRLIGEHIELVTLQDGELRPILSDPGQIEQIIVNLVVNARDAMPQGGRIQIETANFTTDQAIATASGSLKAGDYVVLRVSDTGTGMDEAIRAKIFEPFFTTKETHKGTGLGLATVYSIVSGSDGLIDVESNTGRGTTFSIYLPTAYERTDQAHPTIQESTLRGSETILLVEDSDSVRRLVRRTLEKSGYRVLVAESATAALRHCGRHAGEIDLLLADIVLPRTSGPEVARRAVELRPGIRVLFMSGFTDDTLSRHGLRPGATQILQKPFTPSAVLARIRSLLDADARPLEETLRLDDSASFPVEHS